MYLNYLTITVHMYYVALLKIMSTFSQMKNAKSWTKKELLFLLLSLLLLLTKAKNEEVNNFFVSKKVLTYEHKTRRKAIFLFELIFSLWSNKSRMTTKTYIWVKSSNRRLLSRLYFLCRFRNINDGKAHLSTGQTVLDAMASHFLPLTDKCKTRCSLLKRGRRRRKKRNEKIRIF